MKVAKGYKRTDIGIIPEDWEVQKLKSVCKLINGRGFKPHEWRKDGLPIIRIQNLNGSEDFNYYKGAFNSKILVEEGQLLFAWSGSRGTSFGPHIWNGKNALLNYHTWKVNIVEQKIDKEYFLHLLKLLTRKIEEKAHGASALVHTQKGEMENFEFPFPTSRIEQIEIASKLTDADIHISTLGKLIAKKKNIKQGTMHLLLSGKNKLKGFNAIWKENKLREVAEIKKGKQINKDELTANDIFPVINGGIEPSGYTDKFNTKENTITISEGGNSCGYVSYQTQNFWSGGHCYTIENIQNAILKTFLYHLLKFKEKQIMELRVGSGLPNIQKNRLADFPLSIPPFREQETISEILTDIDLEIRVLQEQLSKYKLVKEAMMQSLLTGNIRLSI